MREDRSTTAPHPRGDISDRLDYAKQLLDSMHRQIRSADEKIGILFSASTLLAAALAFSGQQAFSQVQRGGFTMLELAIIGARLLIFLCVGIAVASAIVALLPRVSSLEQRSLVFFGHIAASTHDGFIEDMDSLTSEQLEQQILSQVYVNARIVSVKYRWTRRAATAFLLAIALFVLVQSLALFA